VASVGARPARVPALTKYDVLEELGHGGMATVYRAHDKRLARDVAIKVLHPHLRESSEIAHRFEAEAKAVAKLRHPNIVEVFDVSAAEDEEQYLVVELIRGDTLRKLLQKRGALPPEVAAALGLELLSALTHAHGAGVVHRDVKPENVLIEHRVADAVPSSKDDPPALSSGPTLPPVSGSARRTPPSPRSGAVHDENRGERIAVKLTDFGIAKLLDAQGVTSTGQVLGSPAHMAPEQIEGGDVDGRADVFGLGVLLYECMVGHLPFEGNNPAQVLRRVLDGIYPTAEREKPTVGKVYSQILDRALARNADDRYRDAQDLRDALSAELSRVGVASPRSVLQAWFDDPEGWSEAHAKTLIKRLCELGGEARKSGDALAAANDYNRALAYAPDDPQLLRIVASMHRAAARARMVKRAVPLVLGVLALGAGSFFVARALKATPVGHGPEVVTPPSALLAAGGAPGSGPSAAAPSTSVASSGSAKLVTAAPRPAVSVLGVVRDAGALANGKKRSVVIASLRPVNGVLVSVDGAAPRETGSDVTFPLDDKAHALVFTCLRDLCDPRSYDVAAGDKDVSLDVTLHIHPGKLVVEGDTMHSYGIDELPTVTLTTGVAVNIPMTNEGTRMITVFDRADPTTKQTVRVPAGGQKIVSFKAP